MKVFLIGMRGAGKTTVGRELAKRLGCLFFDTDEMVEASCKRSVTEIFQSEGELAFREYETQALRTLKSKENNFVVATGGGILLRPENQVLLPKLGLVVYLHAPCALLRSRLGQSGARPSLTGKSIEEETEFLFLTRDPLYNDAADLTVDVEGKTVENLGEEIERKLSKAKKRLPKS